MDQSPLARLSAELRSAIWSLVLTDCAFILDPTQNRPHLQPCLDTGFALIQTCGQIRRETREMIYFESTFYLLGNRIQHGDAHAWHASIERFFGVHFRFVRRIVVALGPRNTATNELVAPQIPWIPIARLRARMHPDGALSIDLTTTAGFTRELVAVRLPLHLRLARDCVLEPFMRRYRPSALGAWRDGVRLTPWREASLPLLQLLGVTQQQAREHYIGWPGDPMEFCEVMERKLASVQKRLEGSNVHYNPDLEYSLLEGPRFSYVVSNSTQQSLRFSRHRRGTSVQNDGIGDR